ncbi:MAG: non-canonical purine NTP pyrophosphatase [Paludibacteraceae bacterium]|nr:non-canonical purine NTP pyrophosphatase [Paludibacteraceae bacterium]
MVFVFATNNQHKLEEARSILSRISILSLSDIGLSADIPEDGLTLEENSMYKCRFVSSYICSKPEIYAKVSGCFSDDTGLEISALGGAPGVHTARWAGEPVDSAANRRKALAELKSMTDRSARFRTVVTLELWNNRNMIAENGMVANNIQTMQFEGIVCGKIAAQEYGEQGFGYDPVFVPQGYEHTFAELPAYIKNRISHRARALAKMNDYIRNEVEL